MTINVGYIKQHIGFSVVLCGFAWKEDSNKWIIKIVVDSFSFDEHND